MTNNKDKKVLNVPNLRFPEFTGEWKKERLDEIAELSKGIGISKEQLSSNGNPCILYGELYTKYKSEIISEVISKTNIEKNKLKHSKQNDELYHVQVRLLLILLLLVVSHLIMFY